MTTKSKPQSAAELVSEFGRQRDELATVGVLLSQRDDKRNNLLLTGSDADILDHDRGTATLKLRRERAAARIEAIRREHPIAVERELEAQRRAIRAEAERQREAGIAAYLRAEAKLREVFPDLAIVFTADQAIANANANAVAGAEPLLPVESFFYRWRNGIASTTELVPRSNDLGEPTHRVIEGRRAVQPEALYNALECPALRPDDAVLRVPGTPVARHAVKILAPASELPAEAAPAKAAESDADPRGSAFMRMAGRG